MTFQIVEALRTVTAEYGTATWTQPLDIAFHRTEITRAVVDGTQEYQHEFVYPDINIDGYIKAVRSIGEIQNKVIDEPLREPVRWHLESSMLRALALHSGEDGRYQTAAVRLDGLPGQDLVADAWSVLTEEAASRAPTARDLTADELAERFNTALANYELDNWHVELSSNMAARVAVNGPLRRVRIRRQTNFSIEAADRLLMHEIGGHVLRWENATRQPEPLAVLPLGSTVSTEEGLALWAESANGLLDPIAYRTYAARTVAVDLARSSGVLHIATTLSPYLGPKEAVEIAVRVKRGLRNPNRAGGLTKDWGYFGGLLTAGKLATDDPLGLRILQGVKWSMDYLPEAKELYAQRRLQMPQLTSDLLRLGIAGRSHIP